MRKAPRDSFAAYRSRLPDGRRDIPIAVSPEPCVARAMLLKRRDPEAQTRAHRRAVAAALVAVCISLVARVPCSRQLLHRRLVETLSERLEAGVEGR